MSIRHLERLASIQTKKDAARYRDRVSRAYVQGLMSTVQYTEYRRYIARVSASL